MSTNYLLGPNLHLTCIILFNLINTPRVRYYDNTPILQKRKLSHADVEKSLLKVTQLESDGAWIQTLVSVTPEPKL